MSQQQSMTPAQALAVIEQERLDVLAEGMSAADCEMIAAYVLASAYRKLLQAPPSATREFTATEIPVDLAGDILGAADMNTPEQVDAALDAAIAADSSTYVPSERKT